MRNKFIDYNNRIKQEYLNQEERETLKSIQERQNDYFIINERGIN